MSLEDTWLSELSLDGFQVKNGTKKNIFLVTMSKQEESLGQHFFSCLTQVRHKINTAIVDQILDSRTGKALFL